MSHFQVHHNSGVTSQIETLTLDDRDVKDLEVYHRSERLDFNNGLGCQKSPSYQFDMTPGGGMVLVTHLLLGRSRDGNLTF